MDLVDYQKYPS